MIEIWALTMSAVVFGSLTMWVADKRGRHYMEGFVLGFLLGIIGLVIELVISAKPKPNVIRDKAVRPSRISDGARMLAELREDVQR